MKYPIVTVLTALLITLSLTGCDDSDYDFDSSQEEAEENFQNNLALSPLFDPANGVIPQTNDLLFSGSTDGTLNIPVEGVEGGRLSLINTLNTLDGFGLTTPITADFSNTLSAESVQLGDSVYVYEVTKAANGAVTGIIAELGAEDMRATVDADSDSLVLLPLKPLKESTAYMVVITNSVATTEGMRAGSASSYLLAKSELPLSGQAAALEPLRQLVNTQEAAAEQAGVARNRVILSWTFTTQSVTPVLTALSAQSAAAPLAVSASLGTTQAFSERFSGHADVHTGTLAVPYYLDASAPLSAFWRGTADSLLTRFNPQPVATSTQTIPVLITVPNETAAAGGVAPETGWPVAIFQHGVTRNRLDALALADTLANLGIVTVAIDLPLHGVTDSSNPLQAANNPAFANDVERTFNLDLQNNETGAPGSDGVIDPSGSYFINLESVPTSRDNIRQGIADLLVLRKSLVNIEALSLDLNRVGFIGHSLGAMVGTGYLSQENSATPASLVAPGGGIVPLLNGSETFGDVIRAGLAANGLVAGSADFNSFLAVAQTVIDVADPIVLGAQAAEKHPIHLIEVVGVDGMGSDNVIPNRVSGAPLAGTEPLIRIMGLPNITENTQNPAGVDGAVRFSEGGHSSILDPTVSFNATVEMQSQVAAFQGSQGMFLPISNNAVIATEAP